MDHAEFESMFRKYSGRIYRLSLKITSSPEAAEEVTQNTFLKLFFNYHSFRGESQISTWLYRVAVNESLMPMRKNRPEEAPIYMELDSGEMSEIPEMRQNDTRHALERMEGLENAIACLSIGYRTVFQLHELEGYEHNEIAIFLGITEGGSKSQLLKARRKIASIMEGGVEARKPHQGRHMNAEFPPSKGYEKLRKYLASVHGEKLITRRTLELLGVDDASLERLVSSKVLEESRRAYRLAENGLERLGSSQISGEKPLAASAAA